MMKEINETLQIRLLTKGSGRFYGLLFKNKTFMEHGTLKGEQCNRDGCTGIIDEHEKEGSCSCHINPPCGYCTTDAAYCPECDWEPKDDIKPIDPEVAKRNQEYYAEEARKHMEAEEKFGRMFTGKDTPTELVIRGYTHTHFSQIQRGVFPPGTETSASILPKVIGTFGGRFNLFDKDRGRFEYVAYTD